jgi:hypothetical protein
MDMTVASEHDALIDRLHLAQEIVDRAQIQTELKPTAFGEILRTLEGRVVERSTPAPPHQHKVVLDRSSLSDRLADVAEALHIDAPVMKQVFADDNDELIIVVAPRRFTGSTRGSIKQIAILIACARQAGGWDHAWTSAALIRAECVRLGFDSKNLGAVLDSLDMFAGRGTGANRQLRAHDESFKAARDVLIEIGVLQESAAA